MRRRPLPRFRFLGLVALIAVVSGCARCRGGRAGPLPERYVPAAVRAVLVVPAVRDAVDDLAALLSTLATFPGAGEIAESRAALTAQLGFDPLDPAALADAGLEPRRGAAVALLDRPGAARGTPLLVLPVRDAPKLEALVARLARDRLGAAERTAETRGRSSVVVYRRAAAAPPALSYAVLERTALLAPGPLGPDVVGEAVALAPASSLGASAAFQAARRALGNEVAAIAFAPPGSPLLANAWPLRDGAAVGLSGGAERLRVIAAVLLGDRAASFRALSGEGEGGRSAALLDPGAALVGRWDGDPAALGRKLVPLVPERERTRLAARGLDLQRDLFDVLAPGAAVAATLAPGLEVTGLSEEAIRDDPLRLLRFEAVLPLRDAAAATALSERLTGAPEPRRARKGGAAQAAAPADGGVYRIKTASGEIAWRVDAVARRLLLAGGERGSLGALEARVRAGGPGFRPPSDDAGAALKSGLGGVVVDPQHLVSSVRALPAEAFGAGPSGFVMRSVVDRLVEPASRLSAVSLRADLAEGALLVSLELEAAAPQVRGER